MSSVLERPVEPPERPPLRVPTPVRRFGYVVAAGVNGLLLWVVHRLLDWQWPAFLTVDFELVLGVVTASFIASIVVNLALAVHHPVRARALADLVTAAFALAVGLRMWEVFPFDFAGYATDWSRFVEVALVVGIVAAGIAIVASLIRLIIGSDPGAGPASEARSPRPERLGPQDPGQPTSPS
jgi:hypothetical protein